MKVELAYLVSRYPSLSHTFILREVLELRRTGCRIEVASINDVDRPASELTREEDAEAQRTYYVKGARVGGALRANWSVGIRRPVAYLRGLWFAMRLGGADFKKVAMMFFYFIEAVLVGRWMQNQRLRHLHVHFATPAATVGLIVSRIFPFTFSITVHGPDEFYDLPGYLLTEKIAAASFLCAIGLYGRSQLMRICEPAQWDKIRVTPLGVNAQAFLPQSHSVDSVFELICVGRLVHSKGQHVLLTAIQKLRRGGRAVRLRLVGDGPDRSSLVAACARLGIERDVIFEGAVNQDNIRELFARADAFVLPSFAEGIPVVLMEAMAMEIPCITTWITGIPELIRDGVNGLLVAPSDETALADAVAQLMDDSELRARLGAAGRRRVIESYDLRRNVARLLQVFEEHLQEPVITVAA